MSPAPVADPRPTVASPANRTTDHDLRSRSKRFDQALDRARGSEPNRERARGPERRDDAARRAPADNSKEPTRETTRSSSEDVDETNAPADRPSNTSTEAIDGEAEQTAEDQTAEQEPTEDAEGETATATTAGVVDANANIAALMVPVTETVEQSETTDADESQTNALEGLALSGETGEAGVDEDGSSDQPETATVADVDINASAESIDLTGTVDESDQDIATVAPSVQLQTEQPTDQAAEATVETSESAGEPSEAMADSSGDDQAATPMRAATNGGQHAGGQDMAETVASAPMGTVDDAASESTTADESGPAARIAVDALTDTSRTVAPSATRADVAIAGVGETGPTAEVATPAAQRAQFSQMVDTADGPDDSDPLWSQVRRAVGSLRTSAEGEQQITIRLRPAELGSVVVRINTGEAGTTVALVTETGAAASQLNQQRSLLIDGLEESGIDGATVDIGTDDGSGQPQDDEDGVNSGPGNSGQGGESGGSRRGNEIDLAAALRAARPRATSSAVDITL